LTPDLEPLRAKRTQSGFATAGRIEPKVSLADYAIWPPHLEGPAFEVHRGVSSVATDDLILSTTARALETDMHLRLLRSDH
jgi:hypothetical protein